MRITGCIALWGDFSGERLAVNQICEDFHWEARRVRCADDLKRLCKDFDVAAVLLHPSGLGMSWRDALQIANGIAPRARVAICHRVEQATFRDEMTAAGAFATLFLPLVRTEVRHVLGFVWASLPENRAGARNFDRIPAAKSAALAKFTPAERRTLTLV